MMKYIIVVCILFASCQKDREIKPEIDKGKADSVYASKFINNKL